MKLCVVGLGSLPLWIEAEKKRTGGAEFQTFLISSKLEKYCEVARVTEGSTVLTPELAKQHNLFPSYIPGTGMKYLRFFHPRISTIWRALQEADADVYYQRAAGSITGIVALFCKVNGRKFVYGMANDNEFDAKKWSKSLYTRIDQKMFAFGIQHAHGVVVQNPTQAQLVQSHVGKDTELIRNIYDGPRAGPSREDLGEYVVNVGNILPKKQHHLLLNLAEACPHIQFKLAGGGAGPYYESVKKRAAGLSNVEMLGFLSREEILKVYGRARLMVHTAHTEGFPNVFLEAWGHGVPVLSLELDPAGVVSGHQLGRVASDMDDLKSQLEQVWVAADEIRAMRSKAVVYLSRFHDAEVIASEYADFFSKVCGKPLKATR